MKYPAQQFELLKKGLQVLNNHFEIDRVHPVELQYILFQKASEGQKHSRYCINENGNIARHYYVNDLGLTGYVLLIDFLNESNFPLYPDGCNDTHIETAVKSAMKAIKNSCPVS